MFEKGIPHWCLYISKEQYLSASTAEHCWCGKVLFIVLNCKMTIFIAKYFLLP